MNSLPAPSVFESFNARNLAPQQVAKHFIPPPLFNDLILRRHSLVIGPRGSGKTTLLKMLQLPALLSWTHAKADHYRSQIDFVGVFVAADVSWGAQLKALGRKLPEDVARPLSLAAFTSHVLIGLIDAMRECAKPILTTIPSLCRLHANLSLQDEAALVDLISQNWRLTPPVRSLLGLKLALRNRLTAIAELPERLVGLSNAEMLEHLRNSPDLHLGFVEAVVFAIEAFNELVGQPDRRWALLFDELEIVPDNIRKSLFLALRSTDQRLIFKLSISPYNEDVHILKSAMSAMPGQDYQPIELWYPRKETGYAFSEALLSSMLSERGFAEVDAEAIFDRSFFDAEEDDAQPSSASGYHPGSRVHNRFKSLAEKDPSFRAYLARNKVNINSIREMSENSRAGLVRKVVSLVAVRDEFRGEAQSDELKVRDRSRKNSVLYTGAHSLFAIVEGNPRWFIGMIGELLRGYALTGQKVPRTTQARAISVVSNRFRALLRTIPIKVSGGATKKSAGASRGLLGLLDSIGGEFHKNVVVNEFSAEPVLSFIVDTGTHPDVLEALGKALNAGAIILVPDENGETLISSVRGKRFRLSYMLAPGYKIPITLGRAGALSQVLKNDPASVDDPLFNWSSKS